MSKLRSSARRLAPWVVAAFAFTTGHRAALAGGFSFGPPQGLSGGGTTISGTTRGGIAEYGGGGWTQVTPSATVGALFQSQGAGADPNYTATPSVTSLAVAAGTFSAGSLIFPGANTFLYQNAAGIVGVSENLYVTEHLGSGIYLTVGRGDTSHLGIPSDMALAWSNSAGNASATKDAGISRNGAGSIYAGNGTPNDRSADFSANRFIAVTSILSSVSGVAGLGGAANLFSSVQLGNTTGAASLPFITGSVHTETATSGTVNLFTNLAATAQDGGTNSTTVPRGISATATFNYTAATKTGHYELIYGSAVETSLPTSTNYLLRLQAGAAGTTDEFTVDNAGNGVFSGALSTSGVHNITSGNDLLSSRDVRGAATGNLYWNTRSTMLSPADGVIEFANNAATSFTRLDFGGTTSSFVALASSGTTLTVGLADGTAGGSFGLGGKVTTYNNVSTAGEGLADIRAQANITAQSSNATITSYANPAADADFEVSAQMNVSASTTLTTTLTCTYTDVQNSARTFVLPVTAENGTMVAAGAISGAGATRWETPVMHIRAKASTTITLLTSAGTFTGITYSASGVIKKTS